MAQLDPMEEAAVLPAFHDERYEFNAPKVGDWTRRAAGVVVAARRGPSDVLR